MVLLMGLLFVFYHGRNLTHLITNGKDLVEGKKQSNNLE